MRVRASKKNQNVRSRKREGIVLLTVYSEGQTHPDALKGMEVDDDLNPMPLVSSQALRRTLSKLPFDPITCTPLDLIVWGQYTCNLLLQGVFGGYAQSLISMNALLSYRNFEASLAKGIKARYS